ncbi:MAG: SDR family NAD(P)-dependent oxidoreductase, partial [Chitinophagales bacterium]|nr:SDR family NAD(P)-dependent oxidoreductase [Chitinophagales bacterium]
MTTVFVTGTTSGFGKAIAEKFAQKGYSVVITGRRHERLQSLASALKQSCNAEVLPLLFDVRDRHAVNQAISSMPEKWKESISILVNNAGLAAGLDSIQEGSSDDWDTMIDTNVKGLLYVTKAIIPFLIQNSHGHIINIGSTAAKYVYEKGNV